MDRSIPESSYRNILSVKDFEFVKGDVGRVFEGFGSVEVVDTQGDIIPVEVIAKVMPMVMSRGGIINDGHTNRHVGKILDWAIKEKNSKPGIWIKGKIFGDYTVDDKVWREIKNGTITGLSLGGKVLSQETILDGGIPEDIIREAEIFEWSVVRKPANPEAKIEKINYIAKEEVEKTEEVEINAVKEEFPGGFKGCVQHFLNDPDFHAQEGRTREESARALCAYIGRRSGKIKSIAEAFEKESAEKNNAKNIQNKNDGDIKMEKPTEKQEQEAPAPAEAGAVAEKPEDKTEVILSEIKELKEAIQQLTKVIEATVKKPAETEGGVAVVEESKEACNKPKKSEKSLGVTNKEFLEKSTTPKPTIGEASDALTKDIQANPGNNQIRVFSGDELRKMNWSELDDYMNEIKEKNKAVI